MYLYCLGTYSDYSSDKFDTVSRILAGGPLFGYSFTKALSVGEWGFNRVRLYVGVLIFNRVRFYVTKM